MLFIYLFIIRTVLTTYEIESQ